MQWRSPCVDIGRCYCDSGMNLIQTRPRLIIKGRCCRGCEANAWGELVCANVYRY